MSPFVFVTLAVTKLFEADERDARSNVMLQLFFGDVGERLIIPFVFEPPVLIKKF